MKRIAEKAQYFLRSPTVVKALVGHSNIKKTDIVFDIGAGSGVISAVLATRCAHVVSYENDPRVVQKLRENMRKFSNVKIVEKDFLDESLPRSPYKVFANIPFNLSSPILRKLTESIHRPSAIYLVVQKQFAHKLLIDDDRFTGMLGAQVAPIYATRIRKRLERTDFWPHPAVDTVLVELLLRGDPLIPEDRLPAYRQFIADCFNDPKIFARMPRSDAGISLDTKPSQLTCEKWVGLFTLQEKY
jgi:23S rRNA (adenine-N6)-dimethyltransferase